MSPAESRLTALAEEYGVTLTSERAAGGYGQSLDPCTVWSFATTPEPVIAVVKDEHVSLPVNGDVWSTLLGKLRDSLHRMTTKGCG